MRWIKVQSVFYGLQISPVDHWAVCHCSIQTQVRCSINSIPRRCSISEGRVRLLRSGFYALPALFFSPSRELRPLALSLSASHSVSICLKMAANAGSMFQYWKRFDLQQLQVSLSLTTLPCFLSAVKPRSGCSALFTALLRWGFIPDSLFPRSRHWLKRLFLADRKLILFVRFASIQSHGAA